MKLSVASSSCEIMVTCFIVSLFLLGFFVSFWAVNSLYSPVGRVARNERGSTAAIPRPTGELDPAESRANDAQHKLGPRMKLTMHTLQSRSFDVRVDLGRGDVRMAKQLLDLS